MRQKCSRIWTEKESIKGIVKGWPIECKRIPYDLYALNKKPLQMPEIQMLTFWSHFLCLSVALFAFIRLIFF